MMRKKFATAAQMALILPFLFSCGNENKTVDADNETMSLTKYVDPFIGTGEHGHVFMGANLPFGAVQLGPTNMSTGWDWCSGYHYSDSLIVGFAHTHLSGTGIGDLGDIQVMPATGAVKPVKGQAGNPASGYYSPYSHEEEAARPGYYKVRLQRYDIQAELTATTRVGFHQYTFPENENAKLIFDLEAGIADKATETFVQQLNDSTLSGYRFSTGWAKNQQIYFTAVFSRPFRKMEIYEALDLLEGTAQKGKSTKAVLHFSTQKEDKILVKVGVSPVSMENAAANISAELPHWNFEEMVQNADLAWNTELNKIQVEMKDEASMRTFYTALYHTMIAPAVFNDANGDYRGTDGKVYRNASFTNHTIFSLWDTYRAAHPLHTLFQGERVNDMVNSMLAIYEQQGSLPVWHLMGNETFTMPGHSGVQVVADAYLKGFRGFDTALAWQAVKATAMGEGRGLKFVKELGFIPGDSLVESVAMGLEYTISDGAIAQMAKAMGKQEDYEYFLQRSKNYKNYFDPEIRFMRGKVSKTEWRSPFSPFEAKHMNDDFCEGNAWQYTWLVPHDVEGLIELMGGAEAFTQKLDSLFAIEGDMGREASADITGLIGQYAHGNEPGHHIPYLYMYAGQPWKTADKVRYIMDSLYSDKINGLSGNEDVGQMSAWYVLSALGLYQVDPAGGNFVFGSPIVSKATLNLDNGKHFVIEVNGGAGANRYIQQIQLNGKPLSKTFISYNEIIKGGTLQIELGETPSENWGISR